MRQIADSYPPDILKGSQGPTFQYPLRQQAQDMEIAAWNHFRRRRIDRILQKESHFLSKFKTLPKPSDQTNHACLEHVERERCQQF